MKRLLGLILLALAGLGVWLWFAPVPFDPVAWTPDAANASGFTANDRLKGATLAKVGGRGPEDVTLGPDGFLYTGLEDGRIVRLRADGSTPPETYANTGGRPLGLQFDATGVLIVADALKGLLEVRPDGSVTVLTASYQGKPMLFVDDLDIGPDGAIYFSDASTRFALKDNLLDAWEGRATGRLFRFDPASGETKLLLDGLHFANGVALGPNAEFVLVNETMAYRVRRYWLSGPKAGQNDVFIAGLPGFPDNISYDGAGRFWLALVTPRNGLLDGLAPYPWARRMMFSALKLFGIAGPDVVHHGWVAALSPEGKIITDLQDPAGKQVFAVTSVNRFGGMLVLGSLHMDALATIPAP